MRRLRGVRRRHRVGGVLAVVGCASLIAGCAQSYPIPRAPSGDPIDAARSLSDAPEPVREHDDEYSCGRFVLGQGEEVPPEAVTCLATAISSGDAAELAWSFPTVEGDPIVNFVVVAEGSGAVTVYMTNAFDSYGGEPQWTVSSCPDAAAATSLLGCPAA